MRLDFLRHLYDRPQACASVYLVTSRAEENAEEEIGLRWRAAREELAASGAAEETLDALGEAVTDLANAAPGLAAFARAGSVEYVRRLPCPPRREIARLAPLPHLMPLLAQFPPDVPHLRVAADREGGEYVEAPGQEQTPPARVEGEDWPVHKPKAGGWSQDRFQRSAEETWAANAKAFAAVLTTVAGNIGAEFIVLAGDTRARALLLEHLGHPWRDSVVTVDKEIPAGSDVLADAAAEEVRRRARQASRERLDSFRTRHPRGRATEGLGSVVATLRNAAVSDLLLADDPSSTLKLWIGPGAEMGETQEDLRVRGTAEPVLERADAALVRGLVLTDAELHFIPAGEPVPADGVAALLRFG